MLAFFFDFDFFEPSGPDEGCCKFQSRVLEHHYGDRELRRPESRLLPYRPFAIVARGRRWFPAGFQLGRRVPVIVGVTVGVGTVAPKEVRHPTQSITITVGMGTVASKGSYYSKPTQSTTITVGMGTVVSSRFYRNPHLRGALEAGASWRLERVEHLRPGGQGQRLGWNGMHCICRVLSNTVLLRQTMDITTVLPMIR